MVQPTVSTSNSKLGKKIASINLPAGITCRVDAPCKKGCYAMKGHFLHKNVRGCHEKNLQSFFDDKDKFFDEIALKCNNQRYKHFRWHSSGDIVNMDYLKGIISVAKKCKQTKFLCFTKKYELVNDYLSSRDDSDKMHTLPDNLVIVFSCWGAFIPNNPYNLPTSHVRFKKETVFDTNENIPCSAIECKGSCADCVHTAMSCWDLKKGQSVVFNKH